LLFLDIIYPVLFKLMENLEKYKNFRLIANTMRFDEEGFIVGFDDDIIYSYNKNTNLLNQNIDIEGKNVILLGDSLGV
jgi:hypothetical protein